MKPIPIRLRIVRPVLSLLERVEFHDVLEVHDVYSDEVGYYLTYMLSKYSDTQLTIEPRSD